MDVENNESNSIPLLKRVAFTNEFNLENETSNQNEATVEFTENGDNFFGSKDSNPIPRSGTNPYSADIKYRNMIGSRHPKEPTDLFRIITGDYVEELKILFSEKSIRETADILVRICSKVYKRCIQMAVEFRSLKCLQFLLDRYSYVETKVHTDMTQSFYTSQGETVFHILAARSFDLEILNILVRNANAKQMIDRLDSQRNSPLLISTKRRNVEMAKYLVKHGAKIDNINELGESPISVFIKNKEERLFKCFFEIVEEDRLADLVQNRELYDGHTILYPLLACNAGFCHSYSDLQEIVPGNILLKCFQHEIQDMEFLKKCCWYCREIKIIDKVMELTGSDFTLLKDGNGHTPLMWASAGGNAILLSKILSGSSWKEAILASDNDGKTFIHHGVQFNCLELITQENLEKLCDTEDFLNLLNKKDARGYTPLHYAISEGHIEAFSTLTNLGASHKVFGPAPYHRSLLHYAVYADQKTVDGLLESVRNSHGDEVMMALINEGDHRKETAMHLAARKGRTDILFCLLSKKASIKSDYKDRTPLHSAAEGGFADVVSILLQYKADIIDRKDCQDRTALMVASEKGHADVVKLLLSNHARITNDVNGNTCLDYAVDKHFPEVAFVIINFEPPIWREALKQSRIGCRSMMSKLVKQMDNVACSILDKCISYEEDKDPERTKITYDFFLLKKRSTSRNSPFLESMVDCKSYKCLNHPVMAKFLNLSWRSPRVQGMYYASLSIYLLFLLSFTTCVWHPPSRNNTCSAPKNISSQDHKIDHDWRSTKNMVLAGICVPISIMSLLIEIVQFLKEKMRYMKERTNYIEITIYISTIIFFLPVPEGGQHKNTTQMYAGAIGIFLAWIRFIWFLKFFSTFGIYIIMAKRVFLTVVKVFPLILPFLVAFGISFSMILHKERGFDNTPISIFNSLIMMTGEISFREVFLNDRESEYLPLRLCTLGLFLLLVSIAMMNLFTALAVGDTNKVLSNSEEERRWQQAAYILTLERLSPCIRYHALTSHVEYPNKYTFDKVEGAEGGRISGKVGHQYSSIFQGMEQWLITADKPEDIRKLSTEAGGNNYANSSTLESGQSKNSAGITEVPIDNSRIFETFMVEMKESMDLLNVTVKHLERRLEDVQNKLDKKVEKYGEK